MGNTIKHPFVGNARLLNLRRSAYMSKNGISVVDSRLFDTTPPPATAKYLGPSARSARYLGNRTDSVMFLGVGTLFP